MRCRSTLPGNRPDEPSFTSRPDNAERVLLASVLKEILREYLPQRATGNDEERRKQDEARRWIFDDTDGSNEYCFGFLFICSYLGLDPGRTRKNIRALEQGGARKRLYSKLADVDNDSEHGRRSPDNLI